MPVRAIVAAIIVAMCWGGNFSATKFALVDFPPVLSLFVRFIFVTALLAPFALRHARPPLRDMWFLALTLIVLQFSLAFTGMAMGLTVTSVIVGSQMGVPFACVLAAVFFKDFLGPWRSIGLMIAFLGVVIVAGSPNAAAHWGAFLLVVAGAFCWALANMYIKRMPVLPSVVLLFWPGLLSLPMLFVLSLIMDHDQVAIVGNAKLSAWLGVGYSAIFSSIVGYGLWNWLLTRFPMSRVMPFGLLMPVFGILTGVLLFDEQLTTQILLGGAMTIAGVGVITLRRPKLVQIEV